MSIFEAIILGLVQGLTEFIPVSSSGHLVVLHDALDLEASGLAFDVALHIGTLLALLLYFRDDILRLIKSLFKKSPETRLAHMLILATLPAVFTGILLESAAESRFRSSNLVAMNLIIVGVLMIAAERFALRHKKRTKLGDTHRKQALIMGLAQAVAVVPGISRSGSTITAGLFAGLDRVSASRFSFLLAIPITFGATLKVLSGDLALASESQGAVIVGIIAAFLSGLFAIRFLLAFVARHSLAIFAYYRFVLGGLILAAASLR